MEGNGNGKQRRQHHSFQPGNFRITAKCVTHFLHGDSGHLLHILADISEQVRLYSEKEGKPFDGWFSCTTLQIEYETSWGRKMIQRHLRDLVLRSVIETGRDSAPRGRRLVRINYIAIDDMQEKLTALRKLRTSDPVKYKKQLRRVKLSRRITGDNTVP